MSKYKQSGMVSIMVTLIMMLVISLIVIGFAQVSRREQGQALDRQLSTQAFFAAESGVNDVWNLLKTGANLPEKNTCATSASGTTAPYTFDTVLNAADQVSYSCLLVTTKLTNVVVNPVVAGGDSSSVAIESDSPFTALRFKWRSVAAIQPSVADVAKCEATLTAATKPDNLPKAGDWDCPFGILRADIVPTSTLSRTTLSANQKTIFFYPTKAGGTSTQPYVSADGKVVGMTCSAAAACQANVSGLPTGTYAVRLQAVYVDGAVDISAQNGVTDVELKNAQVLVDVTGKAKDVLRRIQVRLPLSGSSAPDYAIVSGSSICKRFQFLGSSSISIPSSISAQDTNNPTCVPMTAGPPAPPELCALPKDITLALDYSNSMVVYPLSNGGRPIDAEKLAAQRFVNQANLGNTGNHLGLITFNANSTVQNPFVFNKGPIINSINNTPTMIGTYLNQVLTDSNTMLNGTAYNSRTKLASDKVLVLFTDGDPGAFETEQQVRTAADAVRASGTEIYVVGFVGSNSNTPMMQYIAGGASRAFFATDQASAEAAFDKILGSIECR